MYAFDNRIREDHQLNPTELSENLPTAPREINNSIRALVSKDLGAEHLSEKVPAKKKIICFLGLPGAGKGTQISEIETATGSKVFHLGKFAKDAGLRDESKRKEGKLLEGLDQKFLDLISKSSDKEIILDGFPRSVEQAELLVSMAKQNVWEIKVVNLKFPDASAADLSLQRQLSRAQAVGEELDQKRYLGKIDRALAMDIAAIEKLTNLGVPTYTVDATLPQDRVTEAVRKALNLDFESLPWERETLAIVEKVSEQTGLEMWLCAGALYRAFWNGKFGPFQESTDKDVFIEKAEDIAKVEAALNTASPTTRWAVHSRVKESQDHYGLAVKSLQQGVMDVPLNFRQGAIRSKSGKVEVILAPGVEADLRRGVIRFNEAFLTKLSVDSLSQTLSDSPSRVRKTLEEYPGLKLEGELSRLYQEKYGEGHQSKEIKTAWDQIEKSVLDNEYGGRAHWNPSSFKPAELKVATEVIDFYRTAQRVPSAPARPKKVDFPVIPENLEPYKCALHYAVSELGDDQFREWLLNQIRSRNPKGGADQYLKSVFDLAKSGRNQEQKETHLGHALHKHLQESMMQLATDELCLKLTQRGYQPDQLKSIRASLRLSMLWHDSGKMHNTHTPGSHELISAKLWQRNKPSWVSETEANLATWMIRTHDLSGRLMRGLTEKTDQKISDENFDPTGTPSYSGSVDISTVKQELLKSGFDLETSLAIHLAVWKADVASVSALRWLLPAVGLAEKLILADHE